MREMAGRRWRGQVPARLARELVPRVDELPEIERRQLLEQSVAANLAEQRVGLQLACRPGGGQVGKGADGSFETVQLVGCSAGLAQSGSGGWATPRPKARPEGRPRALAAASRRGSRQAC